MVDRREYLPYCPICGSFFGTAGEICMLACNHFFCRNCINYFGGQEGYSCPFDRQQSHPKDGAFMGGAIEFLANWVVQIGQDPSCQDDVIDRLLSEIPMIRRNLNFKGMPCRIKASGLVCICNFKCPCDHELVNYQKSPCPFPGCQIRECMFDHSQMQGFPQVVNPTGDSAVQPVQAAQNPSYPPSYQPVASLPKAPPPVTQPLAPVASSSRSGCCDLS